MVSRDIVPFSGKSRRKRLSSKALRSAMADLIRIYAPLVRRGLDVGRC